MRIAEQYSKRADKQNLLTKVSNAAARLLFNENNRR